MNLFYIDDSQKAKCTILGGFIISESDYFKLCKEFHKIKKEYGLMPHHPIKFSPDSNKDPEYLPQKNLLEQNAFKKAVLSLLGKAPITILATLLKEHRQNDKSLRKEHYKLGLEFLAQRFQKELQTKEGGQGRMIVDFPSTGFSPELMRHYLKLKVRGSNWKTFSMGFKNLAETLYYTHGFCCNGIQMADFIVGAVGHCLKTNNPDYIAPIKQKFRVGDNQIKGYGLVLHPKNSLDWNQLLTHFTA